MLITIFVEKPEDCDVGKVIRRGLYGEEYVVKKVTRTGNYRHERRCGAGFQPKTVTSYEVALTIAPNW